MVHVNGSTVGWSSAPEEECIMLMRSIAVIGTAVTIAALPMTAGVAVAATGVDLMDCGLMLEGDSGDCVALLQSSLNAENPGYGLVEDGYYGVDTRIAVLDFQGRHHLPADGNVGPVTLDELESYTGSVATPQPGESVVLTEDDLCGAADLVPDGEGGCTETSDGAIAMGRPVGECAYEQVTKLYQQIANRKKGVGGLVIAAGKGGLKRLVAPLQVAKCILWDMPDNQ
jgi:peptidoglycan hydrolase-like protein with peptidoglycan-binding domain